MLKRIMVHSGIFHMDDVLCVAMMKILIPDIEVVRVDVVPEDITTDTIVCDIGWGRYDHHQPDAKLREDGKKRAACGLLFEDIGNLLFPTENSRDRFEQEFIIPIENQDNGYFRNPLSVAIKDMNPSWDSEENVDDAFNKAVEFTMAIVQNEIKGAESELAAKKKALELIERADDPRIIVMDKYMPISGYVADRGALYLIFPSMRNGWNVNCIKDRSILPTEWVTNPPEGMNFIHAGRFMAVFDTREQAVNNIKKLLEEQDNE